MSVELQVRKITYEMGEFDISDVLTLQAAAERLGMSLQSVINRVNRGKLTELVDLDSMHPRRNRRYVLRLEVEDLAARFDKAQKWGEKAVD